MPAGFVPGLPAKLGRFVIVAEIGKGEMGRVYRAKDPLLDKEVALKATRFPRGNEAMRSLFAREARAAACLDHPHVAKAIDIVEDGDHLFIVMDYFPGGSLRQRLKEFPDGRPPLEQAVEWARQLASALAHAGRLKVIHRDVKPANIMLAADGALKLGDFGLAKRLEVDAARTLAGQPMGTPMYMSPEQWLGRDVGPAADQYGCGLVLLEMLLGGEAFRQHADAVRAAPPRDLAALAPAVPKEIAAICLRCLARSPEDRWPDAGVVAQRLARWQERQRLAAASMVSHETLGTACLATGLASAVLAAAVAGPLGWWLGVQAGDERAALLTEQLEELRRQLPPSRR